MAPAPASSKIRDLLLGAGLIAIVFIAYIPVWWAGFIWDDDLVLTANPVIVGPLGLKEIWTTSAANICPLTLTAFWIEHRLWGLHPLPYHIVDLLLHAANGVVLWRLLLRLKVPGAWFGALIWAVHPVDAESVVWISETKNTESALFFLLSILFFTKSLGNEATGARVRIFDYVAALVLAAMAMAAKSSTVVLPLVFALCCVWMEGQWRWKSLIKIAPVLLMAVAASANSLWNQTLHGANDPRWGRSWLERMAQAGDAVWFYLGKLVWPHPLLLNYRLWKVDTRDVFAYLPFFGVVLVSIAFWLGRRSWARPYLWMWTYFLIALLPVLGFSTMMYFNKSYVADHFQYLASMGPLALVGAGLSRLSRPGRLILAPVLCIGLGVLTFRQALIDRNLSTIWSYTVAWNDQSWSGHDGLGSLYMKAKQYDSAISQFEKVCELAPGYAGGHLNLALAYYDQGTFGQAAKEYRVAAALDPMNEIAFLSLGDSLSRTGDSDGAITAFRRAVELVPQDYLAENSLGNELLRRKQSEAAAEVFQKALSIRPDVAGIHFNLGNAFIEMGRRADAAGEYRKAIGIDSNYADAHNGLGVALAGQGDMVGAVREFQEALRLQPSLETARNNLSRAEAILQKHRP